MYNLLEFLAELFVLIVGGGVLVVGVLYVIDRTQTKHAVRRNFPVMGRFRYLFVSIAASCRPMENPCPWTSCIPTTKLSRRPCRRKRHKT